MANAASELMKLDHEEPQLTEPYLSKQKKLMVRLCETGLTINVSKSNSLLCIYLLCYNEPRHEAPRGFEWKKFVYVGEYLVWGIISQVYLVLPGKDTGP